jgi:hypothetical protein
MVWILAPLLYGILNDFLKSLVFCGQLGHGISHGLNLFKHTSGIRRGQAGVFPAKVNV